MGTNARKNRCFYLLYWNRRTLAGNYIGLKEKKKIKIFCADPYGSGMYSYIKKGISKAAYSSITEGIGQSRITKNIEGLAFDGAFKICDQKALNIIYDLIKEEGLFLVQVVALILQEQ